MRSHRETTSSPYSRGDSSSRNRDYDQRSSSRYGGYDNHHDDRHHDRARERSLEKRRRYRSRDNEDNYHRRDRKRYRSRSRESRYSPPRTMNSTTTKSKRDPIHALLSDSLDEEEFERRRDASREREFERRQTQFECIKRAGGYTRLAAKEGEGRQTVRLFWDGFQWIAKQSSNPDGADAAIMNSTRKLRRLYVGNLPLQLGLTETAFQEIVWREMVKRGYTKETDPNPVICVWFAKDKGTYGFVEFGEVSDTDNALQLDGMLVLGVNIKVSRPNDYGMSGAMMGLG